MDSVAQPTTRVRYPGYIRHKKYYANNFPGTAIITLSIIQILMGITAITAQALGGSEFNSGAGVWCGIVFGLSGIFGIVAWNNPTFSTILIYKIFNIMAMILCLPLITLPTVVFSVGYGFSNVILLAVGVIQIIVVVIAFTMITRVLCLPCDTFDDEGDLGDKKAAEVDGTHVEMQHLASSQT